MACKVVTRDGGVGKRVGSCKVNYWVVCSTRDGGQGSGSALVPLPLLERSGRAMGRDKGVGVGTSGAWHPSISLAFPRFLSWLALNTRCSTSAVDGDWPIWRWRKRETWPSPVLLDWTFLEILSFFYCYSSFPFSDRVGGGDAFYGVPLIPLFALLNYCFLPLSLLPPLPTST